MPSDMTTHRARFGFQFIVVLRKSKKILLRRRSLHRMRKMRFTNNLVGNSRWRRAYFIGIRPDRLIFTNTFQGKASTSEP